MRTFLIIRLFFVKCAFVVVKLHYNNVLVDVVYNFSELNIVYQRNGDGEAKSPACRAGVCEAVLHTLK